MRFYLSSFCLGKNPIELARLMPKNKRIAYIPNACDFTNVDLNRRSAWEENDVKGLEDLGLIIEYLDLKRFFGKTGALRKKLKDFGGVYVRGGNTFILRQAMKLSGFDIIIKEMDKGFVYSGYSAGICVLAPDLRALQQVDDPTDKPYGLQETIWEGLGCLDYIILPHYKSDHPESPLIDKEVEFCKKNKIKYRTLRDGKVIII